MRDLLLGKLGGLGDPIREFSSRVFDFKLEEGSLDEFSEIIIREMKDLDFDYTFKDKAGNIMGVIKGYKKGEDMMAVSHMDYAAHDAPPPGYTDTPAQNAESIQYKSGIVASVYAGALLKRSLLPLEGDLIVACLPRAGVYAYGIRELFSDFLRTRKSKLKGVILCEPTDLNLHLGHKGRFEYEIVIRGKAPKSFKEHREKGVMEVIYPLLSELQKVSLTLPIDRALGQSRLTVKNVRYIDRPFETDDEFRVTVDREFVPEENTGSILARARAIAENVSRGSLESDVRVSADLATLNTHSVSGFQMISQKETKPWMMDGYNPFVLDSLEALKDNGFHPSVGYWEHANTVGAYSCGELGIPTVGFGIGNESMSGSQVKAVSLEDVKKAVFGTAIMIHRNIGVPTFGWSTDEI